TDVAPSQSRVEARVGRRRSGRRGVGVDSRSRQAAKKDQGRQPPTSEAPRCHMNSNAWREIERVRRKIARTVSNLKGFADFPRRAVRQATARPSASPFGHDSHPDHKNRCAIRSMLTTLAGWRERWHAGRIGTILLGVLSSALLGLLPVLL